MTCTGHSCFFCRSNLSRGASSRVGGFILPNYQLKHDAVCHVNMKKNSSLV